MSTLSRGIDRVLTFAEGWQSTSLTCAWNRMMRQNNRRRKSFTCFILCKSHHRAPELSQVFNAEFPFEKIIETNRSYLAEREREYADRVSANAIMFDGERYVHLSDFLADAVVKRKLNRCLEKMPSFVSRVEEKCPMHSKKCRLLRFMYGFVCFLHLLT